MPLDTELHKVAYKGDCSEIEHELSVSGTDVNAPGSQGRTALHRAVCGLHSKAVTLLLEKGADPTQKDRRGMTPLHWLGIVSCSTIATAEKVSSVTKILVAAVTPTDAVGPWLNAKDGQNKTAVQLALEGAETGNAVCARAFADILISHGAQVEQAEIRGASATNTDASSFKAGGANSQSSCGPCTIS